MANEETKPLLSRSSTPRSQRSYTPASPTFDDRPGSLNQNDRTSPVRDRSRGSDGKQANRGFDGKLANSCHIKAALTSILIAVVFERLTYYGLTGNLVLFLNEAPFNWESYHAVSASFLFFGVTYIMSLLGGWISDSLLGRFKTILLAYGIYLCGYVVLPFIAVNYDSQMNIELPSICPSTNSSAVTNNTSDPPETIFGEPCAGLIIGALTIVAMATGILKANICPFGADQLLQASQQIQLSFFNLFYWCINLGSFLGLGVVAYIEQQESFQTGFIICAVSLGCSAVIFSAGRCCYVCRPRDGSVLTNIVKIFQEAWRNKRQHKVMNCALKKANQEGSHADIDEASPASVKISFLDFAKHCNGGNFHSSLVDDVKKLGMILAVFAVLIPYWLVYFQMQTTFVIQALHMRLDVFNVNYTILHANNSAQEYPIINNNNKFKFAAAWFSLCDALVVIILLPLFDRVIYPRMAKAGYPFTFGKRIVLGMLFAAASMVVAGFVEQFRLKAYWPTSNPCESHAVLQIIGDTVYYAADMSVLWQIPQYTLIGISEVFASVACLQFAVTVAPKSMKAVVTGIFYFFSGVASFIGVAVVLILQRTNTWFQSGDYGDINCRKQCYLAGKMPPGDCHLDYYFFSLAGWEAVGLILFLVVAKVFHLNSEVSVVRSGGKETGSKNKHVQRQSSEPPTPTT
ncbi:unnamed protein product [Candidula unifasciata]|uniref:Solute carrier family 15 member 4 n=1 Tax=Candidula unifasciata TaxID=100452 RepID=A0A8S3Z088_9EUPU|nr:unnamed protein product [Candidula unifasciata]